MNTEPNRSVTPPEPDPIEAWVCQYYPELVRLAVSILDDPADAEDAVQDSLISAVLAQGHFQGQSSLKTWLYSITIHACLDHLRRRKRRDALKNALGSLQRIFSSAPGPEEILSQADRDARLWAEANRLDPRQRIPILLYYRYDLPVAEIARILQVDEGTVHSRLFYARKRLLRQMEKLASDTDTASEALV